MDKYKLPRSDQVEAAAVRLNLQHYLLKDHFQGRLFHPSISYTEPNLRIADIGCGTGIWLLDVAKQVHPTTQLFALDANPAQLPPAVWLPPNLTSAHYDLFTTTPDPALLSTFDIINVSIVFSFLKDEHIDACLRTLTSLLKPGGVLQWTDLDGVNAVCLAPNADLKSSCNPMFGTGLWDMLGQRCAGWVEVLDERMAEAGLGCVEAERLEPDKAALRWWMQEYLMVHEEVRALFERKCLEKGDEVGLAKVGFYGELLERARVEAREEGAVMWYPIVRAVGRRMG